MAFWFLLRSSTVIRNIPHEKDNANTNLQYTYLGIKLKLQFIFRKIACESGGRMELNCFLNWNACQDSLNNYFWAFNFFSCSSSSFNLFSIQRSAVLKMHCSTPSGFHDIIRRIGILCARCWKRFFSKKKKTKIAKVTSDRNSKQQITFRYISIQLCVSCRWTVCCPCMFVFHFVRSLY